MFEVVVVGTSLGGLTALQLLLGGLPHNFPVAIAIVQHRHRESDHHLGDFLARRLLLPVREVKDKDEILPQHIYLAPVDYHLLIESGYFSLSTDNPVGYARPSIDVLFESAADIYREQVIGIILTGANSDGAQGLAQIKASGGVAIVQDPATAESSIMPQAALNTTRVDAVLPLPEIAPYLVQLCSSARR